MRRPPRLTIRLLCPICLALSLGAQRRWPACLPDVVLQFTSAATAQLVEPQQARFGRAPPEPRHPRRPARLRRSSRSLVRLTPKQPEQRTCLAACRRNPSRLRVPAARRCFSGGPPSRPGGDLHDVVSVSRGLPRHGPVDRGPGLVLFDTPRPLARQTPDTVSAQERS